MVRKDAKTVPYWDNPMEYPMASSKDENLAAVKALHLAMAREVAMDQTWASKSEVRKDAKTVSYWDKPMEFPMAASKDEDLDATMALHLATAREIAMDQAWASNLVLRKDTKTVTYWDKPMEFPMAASKEENLDATKALHLATTRGSVMDQEWASKLVVR